MIFSSPAFFFRTVENFLVALMDSVEISDNYNANGYIIHELVSWSEYSQGLGFSINVLKQRDQLV